jgi:uncharacterized phiE125 gp8 family phage protein
MAVKLVTGPAEEPVSLAEAKSFLRVDSSSEDLFITSLIKAATQFAEKATGRVFITQTWDLTLDAFPFTAKQNAGWWDGMREGSIVDLVDRKGLIEIPKPPLQSITHLKTFDTGNAEATFDSANYFVDTQSTPGRLALNHGVTWPSTALRPVNGIQIRFDAGFGSATDVPQPIKQAILMLAAHWYENHEAIVTGTISKEVEFGTKALLQPYEVVRL